MWYLCKARILLSWETATPGKARILPEKYTRGILPPCGLWFTISNFAAESTILMKSRILFVLAAIFFCALGMRAQEDEHYYAIYCEGDQSLHFLFSETKLTAGKTLESNGEPITYVNRVERTLTGENIPAWNNNSKESKDIILATTVVFEESFRDVEVASCHLWFSGFSKLTKIEGIENLNTSNVTEFSNMFEKCSSLTSLDLSSFNTANVTTMYHMFTDCSSLESLDLSSFDTANVTNMESMFSGCENLTSLELSNFDTANVSSMISMFMQCKKLSSLDISSFDTSNVTNMSLMFKWCESLTALDLVSFDTSNVTDMSSMFQWCDNLAAIYVSNNFKTDKVTDSDAMFDECDKLPDFDYDDDVTKAHYGEGGYFTYALPLGVPCAVYFKGDQPLLFIVPDETSRFEYPGSTVSQVWRLGGKTNPAWGETEVKDITTVEIDQSFASCPPSNCAGLFSGFTNLTAITGLGNLNTENVTSMREMFSGCGGLTSIDVNNFDTSNVTDMASMFNGCSGVITLAVGNFDTSNVTDMSSMFNGCSSLATLDLSNFNTANVTGMASMFDGCSNLTTLGLSSFNTEKVAEMGSMFDGCPTLRMVDLTKATMPDFSLVENVLPVYVLAFVPEAISVSEGRANIVAGDQCESLVINNGENNRQLLLNVPQAFTAQKVTINRSFAEGQPYTLYLPFELNVADYGTFYNGGEYDAEKGEVIFSTITEGQTEAHKPYMFIPNQDFTTGITIEGPVEVSVTPADTEADGLNGVYEKRVFTADDEAQNVYYGWAGGEFCWAMEGATVDACRAYYKLPASAAVSAPARLKVIFGGNGGGGTTGIDTIGTDTGDAPRYDINGRRTGAGYRGIVIEKGRKTLNIAR